MRKSIPFLSIDSIKSLFGDWLHWKPPSALDYSCKVPISFFTVHRYGHLFYYTARCKAWSLNIRDHPFLRIILCTDSRTSVWVLGIALLSQISVITLVVPFQDQFSPIKIKMHVSWNLKTTLQSEVIQPVFNSLSCCFLKALMIIHTIISVQCAWPGPALFYGKTESKCNMQ